MNKYNKSRHVVYKLQYHIIFVTKYRRKILTKDIFNSLINIINSVAEKIDCKILEINGELDHIHFILETKPNTSSITTLVTIIKGVSSRLLRKKYPDINNLLYGKKAKLWSRSYFVATVGGVSLDVLKRYIENQDTPNSSPTCRG